MKTSLRAATFGLILALSTGAQMASAEVYATLASSSSLSTYDPLATSAPAPSAAPSDSSGDSSCGCTNGCGDVCYNPSRDWACTVGVEATYLQPITHDTAVDPAAFQVGDWVDIEHFEAAPRVWIGFENACGRGFRARYWQFDAEDSFHDPILNLGLPPSLDGLDAFALLEAYTVDLEYTRRGQHGCWDTLCSFGVRTAGIERDEFAINYNTTFGTLLSSHFQSEFHGTGLTGALEGRRPVGGGGVNFYGNMRASVLWGPTSQNALSVINDGAITALQIADTNEDNTMFIFETQAGLEWSKCLKCYSGIAFCRLLFEYQYWTVDETSFDFFQSVNGVTVAGASASSDVDFVGVTFAVGISR